MAKRRAGANRSFNSSSVVSLILLEMLWTRGFSVFMRCIHLCTTTTNVNGRASSLQRRTGAIQDTTHTIHMHVQPREQAGCPVSVDTTILFPVSRERTQSAYSACIMSYFIFNCRALKHFSTPSLLVELFSITKRLHIILTFLFNLSKQALAGVT